MFVCSFLSHSFLFTNPKTRKQLQKLKTLNKKNNQSKNSGSAPEFLDGPHQIWVQGVRHKPWPRLGVYGDGRGQRWLHQEGQEAKVAHQLKPGIV